METRKAIMARKDVRKYLKKKVPIRLVLEALNYARFAPTEKNAQSWEFVIIISEGKKEKIAEVAGDWIKDAPVVIVVCSNFDRVKFFLGEKKEISGVIECSAAAQNILLSARDLGLGSAILMDFDRAKVREIIKAPKDVFPVAIITLGYPAEYPTVERDPLQNFLHIEEFGKPWEGEMPKEYEKRRKGFGIFELLK